MPAFLVSATAPSNVPKLSSARHRLALGQTADVGNRSTRTCSCHVIPSSLVTVSVGIGLIANTVSMNEPVDPKTMQWVTLVQVTSVPWIPGIRLVPPRVNHCDLRDL